MSTEIQKWEGAAVEAAGAFAADESNVEIAESLPYLFFVSSKSPKYGDVIEQIGEVDDGTPAVFVDGRYLLAAGCAFQSIREVAYWATLTSDFRPEHVTVEPQPFGARLDGRPLKEHVLSATLVLPKDGGVLSTLTTWRSTKCPALKAYLRGVREAEQPGWAKIAPAHAAVMSAPPRFRVATAIRMKAMAGTYPYQKATGITRVVSDEQQRSLARWLSDAEEQGGFERILAAFERRKANLEELSKKFPAGEPEAA